MNVWHMSGAGNDFMVLDARGRALDFSTLAKRLCSLTNADGFMAVDVSQSADFRLHFYNSDGSRGEMCGNGARCVCRFAYDNGIAGGNMTVQTDAGPVPGARLSENRYRVRLPDPTPPKAAAGTLYTVVGVPHAVVELPTLDFSQKEALRARSRALRFDPAFPKGANVDFFAVTGSGRVRVLTYERGVEDYTLACGTGCGAVSAVLHAQGRGARFACENQGGTLSLSVTPDGLLLEGDAEILKIYTLSDSDF